MPRPLALLAAELLPRLLQPGNSSGGTGTIPGGGGGGGGGAPGGRSYAQIYGSFFAAAGVLTVLSFAWSFWYALHRKAPWWSALPIYIVYISLGDFVSDFTFIAYMPRDTPTLDYVRTSAIVFTIGASFVNMAVVFAYLGWIVARGEEKHRPFVRWLHVHRLCVGVLLFLSLTSARMLTLIYSGMFGLAMFSAPLPVSTMEVLDLLGLITVILEDVPQLAITVWISDTTATWDSVAFTAVAFSVLSVVITSGCRWVTYLYLVDKDRHDNDAVYSDHAKASKAFAQGNMRDMRYMFDSSRGGQGVVRDMSSYDADTARGKRDSVRITEMPRLVAALRKISESNRNLTAASSAAAAASSPRATARGADAGGVSPRAGGTSPREGGASPRVWGPRGAVAGAGGVDSGGGGGCATPVLPPSTSSISPLRRLAVFVGAGPSRATSGGVTGGGSVDGEGAMSVHNVYALVTMPLVVQLGAVGDSSRGSGGNVALRRLRRLSGLGPSARDQQRAAVQHQILASALRKAYDLAGPPPTSSDARDRFFERELDTAALAESEAA